MLSSNRFQASMYLCIDHPDVVIIVPVDALASKDYYIPDSKVHVANTGPIWGRQDPGGAHVGLMNFALWYVLLCYDI